EFVFFHSLAALTTALAKQAKVRDADAGFDPLLEERMEAILPEARRRRIRIVTNMGAANAPAAADCVRQVAARLGVGGFTIAVVTGDDVRELAGGDGFSRLAETGECVNIDDIVSANA